MNSVRISSIFSDKTLFFGGFILLFFSTLTLSLYSDKNILLALPFVVLASVFVISDVKILYWLIVFSIPLSVTLDFSSALSTDFPTEFLCIALSFVLILKFAHHIPEKFYQLVNHPISLGLLIMYFWSIITTITAFDHIIAIKYCMAKIWYWLAFYVMTYFIATTRKNIKTIFWVYYIPFFFTVLYSFGRTALGGFSFEDTNQFSLPFYDNHVIYATSMTMILPFVFFYRRKYPKGSLIRIWLTYSIPFLIIAIYFSYTRACYIALAVGLAATFLLRYKLLTKAYILTVILTIATLLYLSKDYTYLKLAPDYTKTVMHDEFKDHVVSTFQGKDASSMERINMWVSVFRMYQDRPILGYGPNNFYNTYKPYSVMYFKTWVSDNPYHLSCHNYFWLLLAEQGLVGMGLFVFFIGYVFHLLQRLYHMSSVKYNRRLILTICASLASFVLLLFFNDLIETNKNGSLYFIFLALICVLQDWVTSEKRLSYGKNA